MPSDNDKNIAFPKKINEEKKPKQKKKNGKTIGWVIGVIILILISITFILPTTIFSQSNAQSITFGKYNKEKIELNNMDYGNFYAYQVQALTQQQGGQLNFSNVAPIYQSAFYGTAAHIALDQLASQAGYRVTNKAVNDAIISSGAFAGENTTFDMDVYEKADSMTKGYYKALFTEQMPATQVLKDISSAKSGKGEAAFVSKLNSSYRSFRYIVVNQEAYPDDMAQDFFNANSALFATKELSMISFSTEEEAKTAAEEIASGTKTFEEAASSSVDSYSQLGGKVGSSYYYAISDILMDAGAADTIFSLKEGELSAPLQTSFGYSVFRADSEAALPEFTFDTMQNVKSYIAANDPNRMNEYLDSIVNDVYAKAQADFDEAAIAYNLEVTDVAEAVGNVGGASFASGLEYKDPQSILASYATANKDYYKKLYSTEIGTVLEPVKNGNSYIIAKSVESTGNNDYLASYMDMMFSYYGSNLIQEDAYAVVAVSPKLENNFLDVFYKEVLGI